MCNLKNIQLILKTFIIDFSLSHNLLIYLIIASAIAVKTIQEGQKIFFKFAVRAVTAGQNLSQEVDNLVNVGTTMYIVEHPIENGG